VKTKKTNFVILLIGIASIILLGVMMWFLEDKTNLRKLAAVAADLKKNSGIEGADFEVTTDFLKGKKQGIKVTYTPPERVLSGSEDAREREAFATALFVFEAAKRANTASVHEQKRSERMKVKMSAAPPQRPWV